MSLQIKKREKNYCELRTKTVIAAGTFYNCEWMVDDIYKVALNVGQKSLEARQGKKVHRIAHKRLPREREKATEIPTLAVNGKEQQGPNIGEVSHTIKVTRKTYDTLAVCCTLATLARFLQAE